MLPITQPRQIDDAVDSLSTLLDDANDDFRVFSNVLQRIFEKWSSSYPKDYEMAYGTLSVPGVAEMFVRTEMCGFHYLEVLKSLKTIFVFVFVTILISSTRLMNRWNQGLGMRLL